MSILSDHDLAQAAITWAQEQPGYTKHVNLQTLIDRYLESKKTEQKK